MSEKFCPQCGAPIEEGATACRYCRTPVNGADTSSVSQSYSQGTVYEDRGMSGQDDVQSHKLHAILAYFGVLVLIPIFAAPDSRFARFHANQGLTLLIMSIVLSIIDGIIGFFLIGFIVDILRIVIVILAIMGIVAAAKGEEKELPIIGEIRLLK